MGWSYPELSLEDLMKLIENFIDMLILASGYQSTGRPAHWDSHNIKKSFQWALFLESVMKGLKNSVDYRDSVKELDAALLELKSNPRFPQGLAHLSCTTLGRARDLLLAHLTQTLPLRESHLKDTITASVEVDLSKLQMIENDCLDIYLEKLMLMPPKELMEESKISTDALSSGEHDNWVDGDFSVLAIQQLGKRQLAVSCTSAVEAGWENIWKTIGQSMHDELGKTSNSEQMKPSACLITEELPIEPNVWSNWKSRSLSYMLDKRTIRILSGASLICSTPQARWSQMFEQLNISAESDGLCETIELLLLGCIADKWSSLIENLMSVSYESLTIKRLYYEVFNLPLGKSLNLFPKEDSTNPKEKSIIDYLGVLLSSQPNQLWKISPFLLAVAIPSRCSDPISVSWRVNSGEILWQAGTAFAWLRQSIGNVRWLREFGVFIFFISVDPIPHGEQILLHDWPGYLLELISGEREEERKQPKCPEPNFEYRIQKNGLKQIQDIAAFADV